MDSLGERLDFDSDLREVAGYFWLSLVFLAYNSVDSLGFVSFSSAGYSCIAA